MENRELSERQLDAVTGGKENGPVVKMGIFGTLAFYTLTTSNGYTINGAIYSTGKSH